MSHTKAPLWVPKSPSIITRRALLTGASALGAYAALGANPAEASSSWALVAHTIKSSATTPFTTTAIDTTGANFLCAVVSSVYGITSFADNKSNSWTFGYNFTITGGILQLAFLYTAAATALVGTGHTFSITDNGGNVQDTLFVAAFSGGAATPYDSTAGTAQNSGASSTSVQPGSITPTAGGELIVAGGFIESSTGTVSIDQGFNITDSQVRNGSLGFGGSLSYLIQGAASAVNPTLTNVGGSSAKLGAGQMAFTPASYSPGGATNKLLLHPTP